MVQGYTGVPTKKNNLDNDHCQNWWEVGERPFPSIVQLQGSSWSKSSQLRKKDSPNGNDQTEPTAQYNSSSVSTSSGGRGAAPSKMISFIPVFLCFFHTQLFGTFSFFNNYVSVFLDSNILCTCWYGWPYPRPGYACLPACLLADNLKFNAFRLRRSAEPLPNGLADLRNRDALDLE